MNQKDIDLLIEMLKDLKAKNAELSQNLASLQKDYHEVVKSLASLQSNNNTAAQQSQSDNKITKYSDFPQPRVSRVKEILASGVSKAQEPAQQGESKESNTQTYTNNEIGGMQVETIDRNGIVFFKLTDIEKVLGLSAGQSAKWVKENWFDDDEIVELRNSQLGGHPLKFVAESGLYRILNRTNSPKAKPFERWVTKEVLPSIRTAKESKKGVTESYTPISASGATSFSNNDLGNVRIVLQDNEPMFCLSDVAKILDIQNSRDITSALDREFDKGGRFNLHPLETAGGKQNFTFINEPELYFVLMRSNSVKAKPFRQWVVNEVLPSIRKTGSYQSNNQDTLKRYEALFGGKFSVQTPCKQFIMQNIAQAEAKHNAIATELVSYNYTEEFKKGKAKISSKIGLVYDRPVAIDKKPIITKGYLPNEMLRENQSSITANAESNTKVRKR